mmetsp:Transcript_67240/g.161150  ORF Transcript_67240/g.161150 Transcript_67240/m.161150 type:complete len:267 (+) Transcript_67240:111-911(+)
MFVQANRTVPCTMVSPVSIWFKLNLCRPVPRATVYSNTSEAHFTTLFVTDERVLTIAPDSQASHKKVRRTASVVQSQPAKKFSIRKPGFKKSIVPEANSFPACKRIMIVVKGTSYCVLKALSASSVPTTLSKTHINTKHRPRNGTAAAVTPPSFITVKLMHATVSNIISCHCCPLYRLLKNTYDSKAVIGSFVCPKSFMKVPSKYLNAVSCARFDKKKQVATGSNLRIPLGLQLSCTPFQPRLYQVVKEPAVNEHKALLNKTVCFV